MAQPDRRSLVRPVDDLIDRVETAEVVAGQERLEEIPLEHQPGRRQEGIDGSGGRACERVGAVLRTRARSA